MLRIVVSLRESSAIRLLFSRSSMQMLTQQSDFFMQMVSSCCLLPFRMCVSPIDLPAPSFPSFLQCWRIPLWIPAAAAAADGSRLVLSSPVLCLCTSSVLLHATGEMKSTSLNGICICFRSFLANGCCFASQWWSVTSKTGFLGAHPKHCSRSSGVF